MTTICLEVEEDIKNAATALFASLGLDMETALNIFLRKCIECGDIPFEYRHG